MSELSHYIKLRSGLSGCNAKQFECDKYLDCESCLEDKIKEHDKQIRADAIDEFAKAIICELKNKHTDMPIVDILGSREKWKEKNSQYLECENLAYKIAKKLKAGDKE